MTLLLTRQAFGVVRGEVHLAVRLLLAERLSQLRVDRET